MCVPVCLNSLLLLKYLVHKVYTFTQLTPNTCIYKLSEIKMVPPPPGWVTGRRERFHGFMLGINRF